MARLGAVGLVGAGLGARSAGARLGPGAARRRLRPRRARVRRDHELLAPGSRSRGDHTLAIPGDLGARRCRSTSPTRSATSSSASPSGRRSSARCCASATASTVRWEPVAAAALVLGARRARGRARRRGRRGAGVGYLLRGAERRRRLRRGAGPALDRLYTAWAAIGLRRRARPAASRGGAVADRLHARRPARSARPGDVERTILALGAAHGRRPGARGGVDLVRRLGRRQRRDGSFGRPGQPDRVRDARAACRRAAAGAGAPRARRWLARQQNADGGFNFAGRGRPSGIDDTGGGAAGAGRRRAPGPAGGRAAAASSRPPEPRRRLPAQPGRGLQRPVDRVGGPGAGRRGAQPGAPAARLARPRLPALADRARRGRSLLAGTSADAGLGHGAGADGARRAGAAGAVPTMSAPA